MNILFVAFLVVLGLLVTFIVYPPAFVILEEFIVDVMPGLDFGATLTAYVGAMPLILLVLMVLASVWIIRNR